MKTERERMQFMFDRAWHWWPFSRLDTPYAEFYETSFYFLDLVRISFKRRYKK
jgi:hypothetical protein